MERFEVLASRLRSPGGDFVFTMSNFIHRFLLLSDQLSVFVDSVLF
jgi:hypothetical protein